jgi:DHA1 family bicyclomycin/chloramphenicol resistance-like MFS transporter
MSDGQTEPAAARLPHAEFVSLIAFIMALNAMAIDVILPALQQIGASLGVADENTRQLPITAYVAFFGVSQLVYGTLSDHFGRRPVLLFGLAIYVIGCLGAAMAGNFPMLLAMRGIQGIGAGATRVIAISVIRDTYGGRRMASVMSLAMMVFMAVPIVAPNVGQAILMVAGWRSILVAIAIFGMVMTAWCFTRLPETLHPEDRRALRFRPIVEAFRIVLSNRVASGYAIGTGLVFGCLFAFLNSAQQIYQDEYKLGALFPVAFSAAAAFIAIAAFTNSRLVERFGMRRLSHSALVIFIAAAALLFALAAFNGGRVPFWVFFLCTLVTFCMFPFMGTNFNALAMDPLGHVAGTASSVLSSVQTILGGTLGALIGLAYDGTIMPLTIGYLILSLLSFAVIAMTEPGRLFGRADPRSPH